MKKEYDKDFYKKLIFIALPIAFQNLITASLNTIDTFMISSLSDVAIASVNQANKLFFIFCLILFGISSGSSVFTSQYWGKKDVENIRKVLGICLIVGILLSTFFTILATLTPHFIMRIFTNEIEVINLGSKYLRIVGISYLFTAISFSYVFILRSTQQVMLPVIVSLGSIVVNTFLNWVLIFGNLNMPVLGVEGAAIATTIARVIECFVLIIIVYKKELPAAGKFKEIFTFDKKYYANFFNTVLPIIGNELMWVLGVTMYSIVYGRMGTQIMSTMAITQTIEQLAFVLFFGISNASGIMLGHELGKNNLETAEKYSKRYIKMVILLGILTGILIVFLSPHIVKLFNVTEQVKINIGHCLMVFSFYLTFKVVNVLIIIGILRSGGDTKYTMMLDVIGVWVIGVPLAILGGLVLKLDIYIVYGMIMTEEIFKCILGYKRVASKKWLKTLV